MVMASAPQRTRSSCLQSSSTVHWQGGDVQTEEGRQTLTAETAGNPAAPRATAQRGSAGPGLGSGTMVSSPLHLTHRGREGRCSRLSKSCSKQVRWHTCI